MRIPMLAAALGVLALLAPVPRAQAAKVARVVPGPLAVSLSPGDTVQLNAFPLTGGGRVIGNAKIRWKSSARGVATVGRGGLLTAVRRGRATITARVGSKKAKIDVRVVRQTATSGLESIQHVIADEESVYWTENGSETVRVRKMLKSNGAILDLAREPATGDTGLTTQYLDLRLAGGYLFWSSFVQGFEPHAAVLAVPKTGGPRTAPLPFDSGYVPLVATGWGVSGRYLIAAIRRPDLISSNLPRNTRVAAFDTQTGRWKPLIRGLFRSGFGYITAGDATHVYVRARTEEGRFVILRVDPAAEADTYDTLLSQRAEDVRYGELGATDGEYVYYWTGNDRDDFRLMRIPVTGAEEGQLLTRDQYGPGLIADAGTLYWVRTNGTLVSLPVTGGVLPTQLLSGVAANSAVAGLGQDEAGIYVARNRGGGWTISRVNK